MLGIYHPGEVSVQARAGVEDMAQQVEGVIEPMISPRAQEFIEQQPMVFVASVDAEGRGWASVLAGRPGFMKAVDERTIHIDAAPNLGDPLRHNVLVHTYMGLLVMDFATRRRLRVNGLAERQPDGSFCVRAQQVYGNCPKYIQARQVEISAPVAPNASNVYRSDQLTAKQQQWITQADTFFIASSHPERGADASHRGGNPGFVTAPDANTLVWPDYAGNNMFNTLGNIDVNPRVGLIFLDFETGSTLQLTGEAQIVWDQARIAQHKGAERLVSFHITQVLEIQSWLPLRWQFDSYSPFNP